MPKSLSASGLEPETNGLKGRCSTIELHTQIKKYFLGESNPCSYREKVMSWPLDEESGKTLLLEKTYMANFFYQNLITFNLDPLEQFEVLPLLGSGGSFSMTNLSLIFLINLIILAVWLGLFNYRIANTYDFALFNLFKLVQSMVKENLYVKKQQYFTAIFFLFMVLLLANMVGMIPYSFTITSSFIVTFFLSLTFFIGLNVVAAVSHQWHFFGMLLPSGAPLAIAPFLVFIEAVSYIARVFSLAIRLFANMMSGHALLKILIGFSWTLLTSGTLMILLAPMPWIVVTAIMFLELLIAFLQAYVFSILVTLYINDAVNVH